MEMSGKSKEDIMIGIGDFVRRISIVLALASAIGMLFFGMKASVQKQGPAELVSVYANNLMLQRGGR